MTITYITPELEIVEFDTDCALCLEAVSGDKPDLGVDGQSNESSTASMPY